MLKTLSILAKARRSDICNDPFPHLIIKDFYPEDIYSSFKDALPSNNFIERRQQILSDGKAGQLILRMQDILGGDRHSWEGINLWRSFFKYHSSAAFWQELARLFGPEIRENFIFKNDYGHNNIDILRKGFIPTVSCGKLPFKSKYNSIDEFVGVAIEDFNCEANQSDEFFYKVDADTLLKIKKPGIQFDGRIGIYQPKQSLIDKDFLLPPHIDFLYSPIVVVLYFKDDGDHDKGGNLCLYRAKNNNYDIDYNWRRKNEVDVVKTIEYDKNIAVVFVNSSRSIHGVSSKLKYSSTRRMVYISPKLTGIDEYGRIKGIMTYKNGENIPSWIKGASYLRS